MTVYTPRASLQTIWDDFCTSTHEMVTVAKFVEKQASNLITCRQSQCDIRAQISLIKGIEKLANKIASRPPDLHEFWYHLCSYYTKGGYFIL